MNIGSLVKIIGYAVDFDGIGIVVDMRYAERNRKPIIYRKIMLPDSSVHWCSPEELEEIE